MKIKKLKKVAIVSGGFDPLHAGHIRLIKEAKKLGDILIVILNNDNWLMNKKGYVFMDQLTRREILEELKSVCYVINTYHEIDDKDMSVCAEIRDLKKIYGDEIELIFVNGGDRKAENIPEYSLCKELRIKMLFNIGGEKISSSSELVKDAIKKCQVKR